MPQTELHDVEDRISEIYLRESRRVFATLVRLISNFDMAGEMLHEAFSIAIERWPIERIPDNPYSWLVSTARFKAIDAIRRRERFVEAYRVSSSSRLGRGQFYIRLKNIAND